MLSTMQHAWNALNTNECFPQVKCNVANGDRAQGGLSHIVIIILKGLIAHRSYPFSSQMTHNPKTIRLKTTFKQLFQTEERFDNKVKADPSGSFAPPNLTNIL